MVLSPDGLTVQPQMWPIVLQGCMWHSTDSRRVEQPCTARFDSLHSSHKPTCITSVASGLHRQAVFKFGKAKIGSNWQSPQSLGHVCLACSTGSSLCEFRPEGRSCCDWPMWGRECRSTSRGSEAPGILLPPVVEKFTLKSCCLSCKTIAKTVPCREVRGACLYASQTNSAST